MKIIFEDGPDAGRVTDYTYSDNVVNIVIGSFNQPDDGYLKARYTRTYETDSDGNSIFKFKEML